MNVFLGIASIIICSYMGVIFSDKFTARNCFYNDFMNFNTKMKSVTSFSHQSISEIVNELDDSDFKKCVVSLFGETEYCKLRYLSSEEQDFVKEYLNFIGKSDSVTQLSYLNSVESEIKSLSKKASEEYKKYRNLYIKLGFLVGLIIFVVLL